MNYLPVLNNQELLSTLKISSYGLIDFVEIYIRGGTQAVVRRLFLLFVILVLVSAGSAQTNTSSYDTIIQRGELRMGISTNAPAGEDPLTYKYTENLNLKMAVYDLQLSEQVATFLSINLRASTFDDHGELRLSLTTIHNSTSFHASLASITIGESKLDITDANITNQVYTYETNGSTSISLDFVGKYFERLSLQQFELPASVQFSSFAPVDYNVGAVSMDQWEELIPVLTADTVILPLVAVGAAAHLLFQTQSSAISTGVTSQLDQVKETIDDTKFKVNEVIDDNELIIDISRKTKEVVDFSVDAYAIHQDLDEEDKTSWLTRWAKITLAIYLFLLVLVSTRLFYLYPLTVDRLIIATYTSYTTVYLLLLFVFFLFSFLRRPVLSKIGEFIPAIHVIFIGLGLLIFVIVPLSHIIGVVDPRDFRGWSDTAFLSLISMGFVITALFAGYYLARSGTSWASIFDSIMSKFSLPVGFRRTAIRSLTFLFFLIVIFRLGKTLALALTTLVSSELSTNAYLVSLAASYLNDEGAGSVWLVYGLIMAFFLQAIMAIFLHLSKERVVKNFDSKPAFIAYRRLALLLLIGVIGFIHFILLLQGKVHELGLDNLVYPGAKLNSRDVFNVLFVVPPFKILLDLLLAFGLVVSLPFAIKEMWAYANEPGNKSNTDDPTDQDQ